MTFDTDVSSWVALDVAGRMGLTLPDTGISRGLSLPRARAAGGLYWEDWASAQLACSMVRSGGNAGYIGVDGEALVPEVQIAEARGHLPWGLMAGAGLVADPWVAPGDRAWGLRAIAPTFAEYAGWMDSSDMGGWLGWQTASQKLALRLDLSAGEGARYRERNEGKDLALSMALAPLVDPEMFNLDLYIKNGSRGLGLVRDHRAGLRIYGTAGPIDWGAEGLLAWGIGGDAERQPLAGSLWLQAHPFGPLLFYTRIDHATESFGEAEARTQTLFAGAGVELPDAQQHPLQLVAGYTHQRVGDAVAEIAGSAIQQNTDILFLQLSVSLSSCGADCASNALFGS